MGAPVTQVGRTLFTQLALPVKIPVGMRVFTSTKGRGGNLLYEDKLQKQVEIRRQTRETGPPDFRNGSL